VFKGQHRAELWRVRQQINFRRISVLSTCKSIITDFRRSLWSVVDVDSALVSWHLVGGRSIADILDVRAASILDVKSELCTSRTSIYLQCPYGAKTREQNQLPEECFIKLTQLALSTAVQNSYPVSTKASPPSERH
jgi:hypothetical protein